MAVHLPALLLLCLDCIALNTSAWSYVADTTSPGLAAEGAYKPMQQLAHCCGCRCYCCGLLQHDCCSYGVAHVVTPKWQLPAFEVPQSARAMLQLPVAGWQLTVWAPCSEMSSRPCQHLEARAQAHMRASISRAPHLPHQPSTVAASSAAA